MRIDWDDAKRESNLLKHGIDFFRVIDLFDGRPVVHFPSKFTDETRWLTTGEVDDRMVTAVWTMRDGGIRIISVRSARDAEKREYLKLYD